MTDHQSNARFERPQYRTILNAVLTASGLACLIIGCSVIVGWYGGSSLLALLNLDSFPMHFNSAWAILLCGAGLLSLRFNLNQRAGIIGLPITLYGGFVVSQYLLNIEPGVVPLLPIISPEILSFLPKVSLGTALSLFFMGAAFILIAFFRRLPLFTPLAVISGIIIARSVLAFFHQTAEMAFPAFWIHSTEPYATLAFFCAGIGILSYIFREQPLMIFSPYWLPVMATVMLMSVSLSLWQSLKTREEFRIQQLLTLNALNISNELKAAMNDRSRLMQRMASSWLVRPKGRQEWTLTTSTFFNDFKGFKSLGYINPQFRVTYENPPGTSLFPVGEDGAWEYERQMALAAKSFNTQTPLLSAVKYGADQKLEAYLFVPISAGRRFEGFFAAHLNLSDILASVLANKQANDFKVEIDFGRTVVFNSSNQQPSALWSAPIQIDVQGSKWVMRVSPLPPFMDKYISNLPEVVGGVGFLISFLFGLTIALAQLAFQRSRRFEDLHQRLSHAHSAYINQTAELRESERLLAQSERISEMGSWDWDVQNDKVIWSDEMSRIYGLDPNDGTRAFNQIMTMIHPEDRALFKSTIQAALEDKQPFEFLHRVIRPSGEIRQLHARGNVVVDSGGNVIRMMGTGHDITNFKKTEVALQESQNLFHEFMDASPTVAFLKDEQGRYAYINETFQKVEGVKSEDLLGKTDFDWLPDYVAREIKKNDEAALQSNKVVEFVERVPTADGTMRDWLSFKFPVLAISGKRFIGGVAVDISEKRKAEEAVRKANAELELRVLDRTRDLDQAINNMQSEIMARKKVEKELARRAEELAKSNEELERFALIASHDLQEPLRKISSYGELLSERYKGKIDEKADKFIGYMVDGARRMQTLIRALLLYSRAGRSDVPMEKIPLEQVLKAVISDLESSIQENGAKISIGEMPVVQGNAAQLGQLLQNLVANALKFKNGGAPEISIYSEKREGEWIVHVEDNGIGIQSDSAGKIFQIFQRLHHEKKFPGNGVGLAICKKIVEAHGGKIWVEPSASNGARFSFSLPTVENNGPLVISS